MAYKVEMAKTRSTHAPRVRLAPQCNAAIAKVCAAIRKIWVVGSYFGTDLVRSLWPLGTF